MEKATRIGYYSLVSLKEVSPSAALVIFILGINTLLPIPTPVNVIQLVDLNFSQAS
jgi:uncharacterized membrane protein